VKKFLLVIGFTTIASLAHGQGTIAFGNGTLTRFYIRGYPDGVIRTCVSSDNLVVGAFYGPVGTNPDQLALAPGLAIFGPTSGILINAPSVFALPGTEPGQIVSLQIRAWWASFGTDWQAARNSGYYYGETDVRQVTLAPTAGPGTVIWQSSTGTNPNRFLPLGPILGVPEPSVLAIGALGGLVLWFGWRRSARR
jgi:hypothetical protein